MWTPGRAASGSAERSAGFTVLEALVALLVVGLAVVGALQAVSGALRSQAAASRHAEATALAEARLNEISLLGPGSLAALGRTPWRTRRMAGRVYRQRSAVDSAAGGEDLWRAATEVAWEGGSVRLQTVLYRPRRARGAGGSR